MKNLTNSIGCGCLISLATMVGGRVQAQTLFADDFDYVSPLINSSPYYTINRSRTTDSSVILGYDYSDPNLGIPSAPHSVGGTKLGARFDVNTSGGSSASAVLSPISLFPGNYQMTFDIWMNTVGPMPLGGTGSTEHLTAGVGYNGTTFQNSTSGSGVWFAMDGEGGSSGTSSSADYHARIGTTFQGPATPGVYAAGTTTGNPGSSVDNANAYYSFLTGQAPPAAQQSAFPSQTGTSAAGTLAFAWHTVKIVRAGSLVTWEIDGNLIATVNNSAATATDQAFVGYWDAFGSVGNNLVFGIIDNLSVKAVPEPSVLAFSVCGGLGLLLAIRRRK